MTDELERNTEEQIRAVLLAIIRRGILNGRLLGFQGRAQDCANELDHIHNLPGLVTSLKKELLVYYCDVERKGYQRVKSPDVADVGPLWEELDDLMGRL